MRQPLARPLFFLLAAITVAVLLSACGGDQPTAISKEVTAADGGTVSFGSDLTLQIPGGALSGDAVVTVTRASEEKPAPGELDAAMTIGHAFEIDVAGATLIRPVTLTVAYDPDLLPEDMPGEAAFLAYYDEIRREWVPVYGTVGLDQHVVTVEADHLSWWSPAAWLWDKITQTIERSVEGLFAFVGFPEAELPDCSGLPPVHMSLESNEVLLPCIEATGTDGEARLKVVNNRAYSVVMSHPSSAQLTETAKISSLSDAIGERLHKLGVLGRGDVYVPAAGEAQILLRFPEPGAQQISSASAREMLGIDMLLIWLGAVGIDTLTHAAEVIKGVDCIVRAVTADAAPTMLELWNVARECALAMAKPLLRSVFGVLEAFIKTAVLTIPSLTELAIDDFINDGRGEVTVTYRPPMPSPTPTPTPTPTVGPSVPETLPVTPFQVIVVGDSPVNLRSKPHLFGTADVVGILNPGEAATVIARFVYTWYQLDDGCFMSFEVVKPVLDATSVIPFEVSNILDERAYPSYRPWSSHGSLTCHILDPGETATVVARDDWVFYQLEDGSWVYSGAVEEVQQ